MEELRIVFVDDEVCFRSGIEITIDRLFGPNRAFVAEYYSHPDDALDSIRRNPFNVCLVFMDHDFKEEGRPLAIGADYIRQIKRSNPYTDVIMMSGDSSAESLRLWLKNGADKFFYKEFAGQDAKLSVFITESLARFRSKFGRMLSSNRRAMQVPEELRKLGMISSSPSMRGVADVVLQCAPSDLSVLIIGETGTGKEVVARAIHANSSRSKSEFRTVDCTQFKKSELIASELFGSEKGAYTGAESKVGLLETAHGGTVFLDEVHHLGSEAQAMLLRFLQDRKVRRVGGRTEKFVDVRLIFAAKPTLLDLVEQDLFLVDLLYRMKEIKIDLPRLTDRAGDVELLATHFLEKLSGDQNSNGPKRFHPDSIDRLNIYPWPGNVRELENFVKRINVMSKEPVILPSHLEKFGELDGAEFTAETQMPLETIEQLNTRHSLETRALILKTYQMSDFNLAETARRLGIARTSLRSQCVALGIWDNMEKSGLREEVKTKSEFKKRIDRSVRSVLSTVVDFQNDGSNNLNA